MLWGIVSRASICVKPPYTGGILGKLLDFSFGSTHRFILYLSQVKLSLLCLPCLSLCFLPSFGFLDMSMVSFRSPNRTHETVNPSRNCKMVDELQRICYSIVYFQRSDKVHGLVYIATSQAVAASRLYYSRHIKDGLNII